MSKRASRRAKAKLKARQKAYDALPDYHPVATDKTEVKRPGSLNPHR